MFHREIFAKKLMMVSFGAVAFGYSLLSLDFYVFDVFIMSMYHFYYQKTIKLFLFWKKMFSRFLHLPDSSLSCALGNNWQLVIMLLFQCPLLFLSSNPSD